jgi:hypothetical protein
MTMRTASSCGALTPYTLDRRTIMATMQNALYAIVCIGNAVEYCKRYLKPLSIATLTVDSVTEDTLERLEAARAEIDIAISHAKSLLIK